MGEDAVLQPHQEHGGELEALGGVQRHERHPAIGGVELVAVGHEGHRLEELVEAVVLRRRSGQLGDVLDAAVRFEGVLGLEGGAVAGPLGDGLHDAPRAARPRSTMLAQLAEQGARARPRP